MARDSWHGIVAKKAARQAMIEVQRRMAHFSIAEYTANRYAAEMVEVLRGIAIDPAVDVTVRRLCALDVIERSDGKVAQKVQVSHHVDENVSGVTLDHEAVAATTEANELAECERWISSGLSPDTWPEHVRQRFGIEALARFAPGSGLKIEDEQEAALAAG